MKENTLDKNLESALRAYAYSFFGVHYKWGGANPLSGMDCSGLVIELMKAAGVIKNQKDDYTAQGLHDLFFKKTGYAAPSFGALAFYGGNIKKISHVGFCLDAKTMIEAGGGGSAVVDRTSAEEKNAFVRLRPISYRSDYLISVMPPYRD
jgi:cell wall-associated NlpC family hydrolase